MASRRGERAVVVIGLSLVVIVVAGVLYVRHAQVGSPAAPPPNPISAVDHYFSTQVTEGRFSGSVLIAQKGKVLLDKAYGWADQSLGVRNNASTRFRIGSITKQFTAMAVLVLQGQGKLTVHDAICQYVRDCPDAWSAISIEELLTHTSGIPEFLTANFPADRFFSPEDLAATFKSKPLDFTPGTRFSYSNSGYVVLGLIIEKVSGQSYSDFIQQAVLNPLHLGNTGYDNNNESAPLHATGYGKQWTSAISFDPSIPYSAGGLYSNLDDLYRWDTALFQGSSATHVSLKEMFAPHVTACDSVGTICSTERCETQRINCYSYGYGWYLQQFPVGNTYRRAIFHGGSVPGFGALNLYYPGQTITLIVLSNLETFSRDSVTFISAVDSLFVQHTVVT